MPRSEPVSVLVVNEQADEIKLVTLSLRGFFPNCRVEAVYSLDEALLWAPRTAWDLLLIDDRLIFQLSTPILPELKRLAPSASLVLQTDRSDPSVALGALQAGADFLLYKHSPAFSAELVLYTKQAIETGRLKTDLEATQERHTRLIQTLTDVLYELDAEGKFLFVSPTVMPLLGYAPEELTGLPYTTIVPPNQLDRARHRFNDRRSGARASRRTQMELIGKPRPDSAPLRVRADVSARGLYDARRRYQGTLGLIRDLSRDKTQEEAIRDLEQRVRDADRILVAAERLSAVTADLQAPLGAILAQSQQLLGTIRETRLDHQLEALTHQAAEAVRHGHELAAALQDSAIEGATINDLCRDVLARIEPPLAQHSLVECVWAGNLPPFKGPREDTLRLLELLLLLACRYLATTRSPHSLRIATAAVGPTGLPVETTPSLFPGAVPTDVEIAITELERRAGADASWPERPADLMEAYALVRQLGGRLDFSAPAGGALSIRCRLPLTQTTAIAAPGGPKESSSPIVPPTPPAAPQTAAAPQSRVPDRRKTDRTPVHLPAKVTIGNVTREGTVMNISPHGTQLLVEGTVPSMENQSAFVLCKTGVGNLELHATTHHRGVLPRQPGARAETSLLALQFTQAGETEQKVLASFIEAARERLIPFAVEALLALPDNQDAGDPGALEPDLRGIDHREAIRVRSALPVAVETSVGAAPAKPALGLVVNVSRLGACLIMKSAPGAAHDVLLLHFASTGSQGQPRAHEPAAPDAVLAARIVWTAPDRSAPADLRPSPSEPGQRIGVHFTRMTPFSEREINRVVAQHVGSSVDLEGVTGRSSIVSARRECRNARDQVIAITDDHARHQISPNTPIVILSPGFGRTQHDYLGLSFFLAANRLRVLRYDHSNHVGQSDGDSLQTTLRNMQVDLHTILDFAHTTWPTASITLLAEDVAARVALKVAAQNRAANLLVLVNPVLDVQSALTTTYRHDVMRDYRHGLRRGVANLWGLNVNLDQFLGDAVAGDYAGLATTVADLSALSAPSVFLTTPQEGRPVEETFGPLDSSLRGLGEPPAVVALPSDLCVHTAAPAERHLAAFSLVLKQIAAATGAEPVGPDVREPAPRELHRQRQLEEERTRIRHHVSQATRDALWVAHLAQQPQLDALHDYWASLEELYRWALPLESGMTVVDVGCGQSDVARVIQMNQLYRSAHRSDPPGAPLQYVGLGQSHESLKTAERSFHAFHREITGPFARTLPEGPLVTTTWVQTDWGAPLPFLDGAVDRIVGHLSLSFVPSPLATLRQAFRPLRPNGLLTVTCFQPHADLSWSYRRHLRSIGQEEFTPSAQIVLHYLGRLREALRHGLLHSFERDRLAQLLHHAGARPLHILPLLDGQLLLAVAQNGKSAG